MKISIDLDGTMFQHPELYITLINGFRMMGHSVGIMSCRSQEHHPEIVGLDFWLCAGDCSSSLVECENKAKLMIKENVDVAFDDKGLLIYKKCMELDHPEKIILNNWSYYTPDVVKHLQ